MRILHVMSPLQGQSYDLIKLLRGVECDHEQVFLISETEEKALTSCTRLFEFDDLMYLPEYEKNVFKRLAAANSVRDVLNSADRIVFHSLQAISGGVMMWVCVNRALMNKSAWIANEVDMAMLEDRMSGIKRLLCAGKLRLLKRGFKLVGVWYPWLIRRAEAQFGCDVRLAPLPLDPELAKAAKRHERNADTAACRVLAEAQGITDSRAMHAFFSDIERSLGGCGKVLFPFNYMTRFHYGHSAWKTQRTAILALAKTCLSGGACVMNGVTRPELLVRLFDAVGVVCTLNAYRNQTLSVLAMYGGIPIGMSDEEDVREYRRLGINAYRLGELGSSMGAPRCAAPAVVSKLLDEGELRRAWSEFLRELTELQSCDKKGAAR
ncbi:MAG: hypothetical protein Q4B99_01405 [Clostridia bacterium]|nr:hypothetical protein [Clostridia bacterium]